MSDTEAPQVQRRKRGRKKKAEIRLRRSSVDGEIEKLSFSTRSSSRPSEVTGNLEQKNVPFGNLNIIVHKAEKANPEQLRSLLVDSKKESATRQTVLNPPPPKKDVPLSKVPQAKVKKPKAKRSKVKAAQSVPRYRRTNVKSKQYPVMIVHEEGEEKMWPTETDLLCWNCCQQVKGTPIPFPSKYDQVRERFAVSGVFCTWGCVFRYALDNGKKTCNLFPFMRTLGIKDKDGRTPVITPAPPRFALQCFGGPLTVEEFRKRSGAYEYDFPANPMLLFDHIHLLEKKVGGRLERKKKLKTSNEAVKTMFTEKSK